jgi:hypothetical protein
MGAADHADKRRSALLGVRVALQPTSPKDVLKLAGIGVVFAANRGAACRAPVLILVAGRQYEQQVPAYRLRRSARGTEELGGLEGLILASIVHTGIFTTKWKSVKPPFRSPNPEKYATLPLRWTTP